MDKIFGRDKMIASLWKLLADHSILFTAERRIGKTTVLTELLNTHKSGFRVIYSDLEKIDSPLRFVNELLNTTAPFISNTDKASGWFYKLRESLGGLEVGGVIKIPEQKEQDWQISLEATIKAICTNTDDIVVFLWDEVPYMLQKINEHEGSNAKSSLQLMDTLRALRHEHENLRMIYTGSIGLHHVLSAINDDTYASESVNDMQKVGLSPLILAFAQELAQFHIEKEGIEGMEPALIDLLVKSCDLIPFYIEKLIRRLAVHEHVITETSVQREISQILTDSQDEWEMEHFRSRLSIYIKGEIIDTTDRKIKKSVLAKSLLSHCAVSTSPQSIDQCYAALKTSYALDGRDVIVAILSSLVKDHYLLRDEKGHYYFSFSLVQKWWLLAEGLNTSGANAHA